MTNAITYENAGAFIPAKSAAQFSDFQQYEGRTVAVTGKKRFRDTLSRSLGSA